MRIAGIDQGTTSTRVLTAGSDGELQVVHGVEHKQMHPQDGWVEHDPEKLVANIRACANAAGKVDAIGIANQGESRLRDQIRDAVQTAWARVEYAAGNSGSAV